ncbi:MULTISPECIES: hypothetical protein [Enterococcaceae]|nr:MULTISPECIES: hypothetical protein [Enterococcaceae]UNM89295.1 hypothetical protein MN187_08395 [Vagococcus sp. CY52-2]
MMKAILKKRGINIGNVRHPLPTMTLEDKNIVEESYHMIREAIKYVETV